MRWRNWRKPINVQNNNDTLSIRIVVEKMSFQGLSEDADGDCWITELRGKSIPGQRARWGKHAVYTLRLLRCRRSWLLSSELNYQPHQYILGIVSGVNIFIWIVSDQGRLQAFSRVDDDSQEFVSCLCSGIVYRSTHCLIGLSFCWTHLLFESTDESVGPATVIKRRQSRQPFRVQIQLYYRTSVIKGCL